MEGLRHWWFRGYWIATLFALAVAIVMAWMAPTDPGMGPIQKLFYLHVPVAMNMYVACFVVFVSCVAYLGGRKDSWDDLAYSAARVAALLGSVLMLTGILWAWAYWGEWWVWSPRMAFSLLLWVMYLVYLALRPVFGSAARGAMIASVYGVVAFLDVPLVYLSVKLLPDVHPTNLELTIEMKRALAVWMVAITLLTAGLIVTRYTVARGLPRPHSTPTPPALAGRSRPA